MGFSAKQIQALRRSPATVISARGKPMAREFSYLEGWYAISEANRIFGFDGWSRETLETRCVLARENRGSFLAIYIARVRITVKARGATIVREGHGSGEGRGTSPGEVHDIALKAAETDATKRALATFGRPFGLELYRNGRAKLSQSPPLAPATAPSLSLPDSGADCSFQLPPGRYDPDTAAIPLLWPTHGSLDARDDAEGSASATSTRVNHEPGITAPPLAPEAQSRPRQNRQEPTCHRRTQAAA